MEKGGDSWRERGREEEVAQTSGGETMRHGGLFEEEIAEPSQGKGRRQVIGVEERFGARTDDWRDTWPHIETSQCHHPILY